MVHQIYVFKLNTLRFVVAITPAVPHFEDEATTIVSVIIFSTSTFAFLFMVPMCIYQRNSLKNKKLTEAFSKTTFCQRI